MPEQVDKASLLDKIRNNYVALEETLLPLDEAQLTTAGVIAAWSIKDILAHITSWHQRLLIWLQAAIHNEQPTISGPNNVEEMDALNAQFYQANKSRTLAEVQGDFHATYLQILDRIQAMPEVDLISPDKFAWSQGEPLWKLVAGDTYEHYQEHLTQIQEWLTTLDRA